MIAEYCVEGEDSFIDRLSVVEQCVAHVVRDDETAADTECEKSHSDIDDNSGDEEEIETGEDDDDVETNEDEELSRKLNRKLDEKLEKERDEKLDKVDDKIIEEEEEEEEEEKWGGEGEEEEWIEEEGEEEEGEEEVVHYHLPLHISQRYPTLPQAIGDFVLDYGILDPKSLEFLTLPHTALSAYWAAKRLSIVGRHDRRSYCFTHSYGRLYDKSSGSVFWEVCFPFFVIVLFTISFVSQ